MDLSLIRNIYICNQNKGEICNSFEFIENNNIIIGLNSGIMRIVDILEGICLEEFRVHENSVHHIVRLTRGIYVTGGDDGFIKVIDIHTLKCHRKLDFHSDFILDICCF